MAFNLLWINGGNDLTGNLIMFDVFVLVGVFAPKYMHKLEESKLGKIPDFETTKKGTIID
jgi:hypothetical protein